MASEPTGAGGDGGRPPADDWSRDEDGARQLGLGIDEPKLVVELEGWEGPLDLLLALARVQKVDLTHISILDLVDQYLAFVERVRHQRLELAADHLVMASWLAYLKSRLLLPSPAPDQEPSGEELAAALAFRLRRLEAIRGVAAELVARDRLGRDVFARGVGGDGLVVAAEPRWQVAFGDLLSAYAGIRQRQMITSHRVIARNVWPLADAREILLRLVGDVGDWVAIHAGVDRWAPADQRATAIASTFAASLELVREGRLEISQTQPFAPIWARRLPEDPIDEDDPGEGSEPSATTGETR
jgi:segregation and condensation protein A